MRFETVKRFEDARRACLRIARFMAEKSKAEFVHSDLLRSAVERQVEIIGESLGQAAAADPEAEQRIPSLRKIVGMRNRLIHGYDEVDYNIVWDVIMNKLPELQAQLERAIAAAAARPESPPGSEA